MPDGSWLGDLRGVRDRKSEPMPIRVIDYTIDDGRASSAHSEGYRLFTTLLDPAEVSATDLAAAYHQRWEVGLSAFLCKDLTLSDGVRPGRVGQGT